MGRKHESPEAPTATPAAGRNEGRSLAWLQSTAIAITAVALYHVALHGTEAIASGGGAAESRIIVVDTQRLVEAKIQAATDAIASGAEMSQEALTLQGHDFGANLLRALKRYRDEGYVVLDRRNALAIPVGRDVTEQVAKELGVTVAPAVDPFSAPSLE
jgi:hypothetical protein